MKPLSDLVFTLTCCTYLPLLPCGLSVTLSFSFKPVLSHTRTKQIFSSFSYSRPPLPSQTFLFVSAFIHSVHLLHVLQSQFLSFFLSALNTCLLSSDVVYLRFFLLLFFNAFFLSMSPPFTAILVLPLSTSQVIQVCFLLFAYLHTEPTVLEISRNFTCHSYHTSVSSTGALFGRQLFFVLANKSCFHLPGLR